jgi:hypothetical protein
MTSVYDINLEQMKAFANLGYIVLPQVVPRPIIEVATRVIEDLRQREPPPPQGHHSYGLKVTPPHPFLSLLLDTPALPLIESLIGRGRLIIPPQAQVALNIPPHDHRPGGPHIDGLTPLEDDGRPGTFTMLAGFFLTDQAVENVGNLWVWPGTHRACADYFREHGPEALAESIAYDAIGEIYRAYPPVVLPPPRQVLGRTGDMLLAHYMLGHNIGGNTSTTTRQVVYFRLQRFGHRESWKAYVQDVFHDFEPVRKVWKS